MPRRIGENENELKLYDNISGSEIILYYRMPTTKERTGFSAGSIKRVRNKIKFKSDEARLIYGQKILLGFRTGDFERKENGKFVPMASDPKDKHYCEDWKKHIVEHAADLIMLLAAHVFDNSAEIDNEDVESEEDTEKTSDEDAEKNL